MLTLPFAGQLPPSKSHAARRWTFAPSVDPTSPSLGVLTIVQGARDVDSYGVALDGRQILLANLDGNDVYGIALTPAGRPVHCTCTGFAFGRRRGVECKHIAAVRELIADGVLTVAARPDPADLEGGF